MLKTSLEISHFLMRESISTGDTVVDATVGNGHDTLFLAQQVGQNGRVIGFDIQEIAIQRASEKLQEKNVENRVELYATGHENIETIIPIDTIISTAIFNLGYLPNSDKTIVTKAETTISAIHSLLLRLKPTGIIILVVYYGHIGGKEEKEKLIDFSKQLPQKTYKVAQYKFLNQINSPAELIVIEKKQ